MTKIEIPKKSYLALVNRLKSQSIFRQIICLGIMSLLASTLLQGIIFFYDPSGYLEDNSTDLYSGMSIGELLFVLVIFVPLVETLIFQTLIFIGIKKITEFFGYKENWLPALWGIIIIFAIYHGFNGETPEQFILHSISRIPISITLGLYALHQRTIVGGSPFIAVCGLHSFYNLLILLSGLIMEGNFENI